LANFIKGLAQHGAKSVPRYFAENILKSTSAWTTKQDVAGRFDRRADKMESISENKSEKAEKSYFSAAVESVTPWGSFSRSSTPKPTTTAFTGEGSGLRNQHGGYQSTFQSQGLTAAKYPSDCPPLSPRWFYAVDVCQRLQLYLPHTSANKNVTRSPSGSPNY
jgi:hypothetical protein